jgi:hypothetical protein
MAERDCITARNDNAPTEHEVVAQAESLLLEGMKPASVAQWLSLPLHVVHAINRRLLLALAASVVIGGCAASVDDSPDWSLIVTRTQ